MTSVKTGHMAWRPPLEAVLAGVRTMDHEEVVSHRDCDFGKWYFGEGQKFASNPVFREMGEYHEQVHSVAKEVVRLYNTGNKEVARRKMTDFISANRTDNPPRVFFHTLQIYPVTTKPVCQTF